MTIGDRHGGEAAEMEPVDALSPSRQSSRSRHSGEPASVSSCSWPFRSEIFCSESRAAVSLVTATSLLEVNGVGGNATSPRSAKPCLASAYASCGSLGSSPGCLPKNDSSAVPVYSG